MSDVMFPYRVVRREDFLLLQEEFRLLSLEVNQAATFVEQIAKGNFDAEFDYQSVRKSTLADNLVRMRGELRRIGEAEKERRWIAEGLAQFGGILRADNSHHLMTLCDQVITNLVKYLGANQGGLFVYHHLDEAEPYLELYACYAYERKRFLEKKVKLGEGLIGQTFLEKRSVYLTDIPKNYLQITSGLGEATPKSLIIVPLKLNDEMYGIVEIASFRPFLPFHIEFVEKLGENIASTIASVRNNEKTNHLLVDSQRQSQMLRQRETELRQSMEELRLAQEMMYRKQIEVEEVNKKLITGELILKKAVERYKNTEHQLTEKLEEIEKANEEMHLKNQEIEEANRQLHQQEKTLRQVLKTSKESEKSLAEKNAQLLEIDRELTQKLEELQRAKSGMELRQTQLELAKEKLEANEVFLKKALQEAKLAQEKLVEQDQHLIAVLDDSIECIIIVDDIYKILFFNDIARKSFKKIGATIRLGQHLLELADGKLKKLQPYYDEVLRGERVEVTNVSFWDSQDTTLYYYRIVPTMIGSDVTGFAMIIRPSDPLVRELTDQIIEKDLLIEELRSKLAQFGQM